MGLKNYLDEMPEVNERRPFEDIDGYMESDNDYISNNKDACIWFLENRDFLYQEMKTQLKIWCLFLCVNDYNQSDTLLGWWSSFPTDDEVKKVTFSHGLSNKGRATLIDKRELLDSKNNSWSLVEVVEGEPL